MRRQLAAIGGVLLLALAVPAAAGVLIESEETDSFGSTQTTLRLAGDRLRVDGTDGHGGAFTFIFRADKQEMWMIDGTRNVYTVIDRPMLEQMRKQLEMAREAMQQQLSQLPPEQRARIQQESGGKLAAPADRKPPSYEKTGSGIEIGAWKTTRYDVSEDGRKVRVIYTAPWSKLDVDRKDFSSLDAYGKFASTVAGESSELFSLSGEGGPAGFDGFPVRTETLESPKTVTNVKTIRKASFDPLTFEIPPGFSRVSMMEFQGPGVVPPGR